MTATDTTSQVPQAAGDDVLKSGVRGDVSRAFPTGSAAAACPTCFSCPRWCWNC